MEADSVSSDVIPSQHTLGLIILGYSFAIFLEYTTGHVILVSLHLWELGYINNVDLADISYQHEIGLCTAQRRSLPWKQSQTVHAGIHWHHRFDWDSWSFLYFSIWKVETSTEMAMTFTPVTNEELWGFKGLQYQRLCTWRICGNLLKWNRMGIWRWMISTVKLVGLWRSEVRL